MTPKPVRREPGSSPRIRRLAAGTGRGPAECGPEAPPARAPPSKARHDLVRYLAICINVLYVVQVFEGFDQMQHRHRRRPFERDRYRSAVSHLRADRDESCGLQRHAHTLEINRI